MTASFRRGPPVGSYFLAASHSPNKQLQRTVTPKMKRRMPLLMALFVLLLGVMAWIARKLPLRIEVHGDHATAHMEFLGEYPNDIGSIELSHADASQVIWQVVAKDDMVQLHSIQLSVGSNSADLQARGQSVTQIPNIVSEFVLMPNTRYQLRVCPPSRWRRCTAKAFQLNAAKNTQQIAAGDAENPRA